MVANSMTKGNTSLYLHREYVDALKRQGVNLSQVINDFLKEIFEGKTATPELFIIHIKDQRRQQLTLRVRQLEEELQFAQSELAILTKELPQLQTQLRAKAYEENYRLHMQRLARVVMDKAYDIEAILHQLATDPALAATYQFLQEDAGSEDLKGRISAYTKRVARYQFQSQGPST